ncbi:MAG: TIGR01777 family oxidoreductase, partial [Terracidiphilus sp.]
AESRAGSTRALASVLAGLRRPPKTLLVASATGFYGDRGAEMLDETAEAGAGFLPLLCRDWEAAAAPAVEAGIRVAHMRLGVVLTPDGGALGRMVPLFRLGLGGRLGSGRQWMSWIALDDVLAAILFLLERPDLAGPVNLTAPNPVTNAEFTRTLARQLGRPAFLPAPAFALWLAFGQMADEALLASARVYPARLSSSGFRFAYPTLAPALAAALAHRP